MIIKLFILGCRAGTLRLAIDLNVCFSQILPQVSLILCCASRAALKPATSSLHLRTEPWRGSKAFWPKQVSSFFEEILRWVQTMMLWSHNSMSLTHLCHKPCRLFDRCNEDKHDVDNRNQSGQSRVQGLQHVGLSSVLACCYMSHGRRSKCRKLAARARGMCRLLVDADSLKIDLITDAMVLLEKQGWQVSCTIFAEPEREKNKRWRSLMDARNMQFRPVERESGYSDSNDKAIVSEMHCLSRMPGICIALLVYDVDFVAAVQDVSKRCEIIIVLPDRLGNLTFKEFERTGAVILPLACPVPMCPIRATLDENGAGHVQRLLPGEMSQVPRPSREDLDDVCNVLMERGYYEPDEFLPACVVKAWFESVFGSICVYPYECAINAFVHYLRSARHRVLSQKQNCLCFILPLRGSVPGSGITENKRTKCGSRAATGIFRGGGPFILQDSANLAAQALSRMGYLDQKWNTNVDEAKFVFCSTSRNKRNLRKLFLLPQGTDTPKDISAKLRQAFLANTSGKWQMKPSDTDVLPLLRKEGLLQEKANRSAALAAMKRYAAQKGWPSMQNYDSYVSMILTSLSRDHPSRREVYGDTLGYFGVWKGPAKRSHGADGSPAVLEGKLEPPLESAGKDSPPSLECPLNISTPTDQPFPLFESFSVGGVGHH